MKAGLKHKRAARRAFADVLRLPSIVIRLGARPRWYLSGVLRVCLVVPGFVDAVDGRVPRFSRVRTQARARLYHSGPPVNTDNNRISRVLKLFTAPSGRARVSRSRAVERDWRCTATLPPNSDTVEKTALPQAEVIATRCLAQKLLAPQKARGSLCSTLWSWRTWWPLARGRHPTGESTI